LRRLSKAESNKSKTLLPKNVAGVANTKDFLFPSLGDQLITKGGLSMNITRLTRREAMKTCAGLGLAGLSAGAGFLSSSDLWAQTSKHSGQRFKLGVCDWTAGKRAAPTALEVAKQLGLDGIMPTMDDSKDGCPLLRPEVQKQYRTLCAQLQMGIGGLSLGTLIKIPYKSDPRAQKWVADSIEASRAVGTQVVLIPFFGDPADLKNDPKGTDVVIQRFKEIAPQAEKAGVVLGIESWLNAQELMFIVDKVNSKAVQVYYDMGNSHKMGYDIYKEIRTLGKHICQFHAKDYEGLFGKGSINFPEARRAMDDIKFSGWIHIEQGTKPLSVEDVGSDARYLRSVFPKDA
jgi:sugar phosphate isomerase/epimerase